MTIKEIVNALLDLGLTTYEIGTAIGVAQGTVSRYSTGNITRCMSDVSDKAKALLQRERIKKSNEDRARAELQARV